MVIELKEKGGRKRKEKAFEPFSLLSIYITLISCQMCFYLSIFYENACSFTQRETAPLGFLWWNHKDRSLESFEESMHALLFLMGVQDYMFDKVKEEWKL